MMKLAHVEEPLERFFDALEPLHQRIGIILWQLPPFLTKDVARLERFLSQLPKSFNYAVEFRHGSWLVQEVFSMLRRYRITHVSVSSRAMPMDLTVTSDLTYVRFHGLEGGAAHDYTAIELEPWAAHIRSQVRRGHRVFAFFNNDVNAHAPANAKSLMQMMGAASLPEHIAL